MPPPSERRAVSATDELLKNNQEYAARFDKGGLPIPPAKGIAVVACMDARLDVVSLLGLEVGDAHIIRNAGGVVTDDEIRSLAISQRLLGTTEVVLIHHTDCGMLTFTDDEFKRQIQDDTGIKPEWAAEAFSDLDEDVRQSIARVKTRPVFGGGADRQAQPDLEAQGEPGVLGHLVRGPRRREDHLRIDALHTVELAHELLHLLAHLRPDRAPG